MYRKNLFILILIISLFLLVKSFFAFVVYDDLVTIAIAFKINPFSENLIDGYNADCYQGFLNILWTSEIHINGGGIVKFVSEIPIIVYLILIITRISLYTYLIIDIVFIALFYRDTSSKVYRRSVIALIIITSFFLFVKSFFALVLPDQSSSVALAFKINPFAENIVYRYSEATYDGFLLIFWIDELTTFGANLLQGLNDIPLLIFIFADAILIALLYKSTRKRA